MNLITPNWNEKWWKDFTHKIRSLSLFLLTTRFARLAHQTTEATFFVCPTLLPSGRRLQHFLHFSSLAGNNPPCGHTHSLSLLITASPFLWLGPVCGPRKVGGGNCFSLFVVFPPLGALWKELCQELGVGVVRRREVTGFPSLGLAVFETFSWATS